jgi:hypothetical protein
VEHLALIVIEAEAVPMRNTVLIPMVANAFAAQMFRKLLLSATRVGQGCIKGGATVGQRWGKGGVSRPGFRGDRVDWFPNFHCSGVVCNLVAHARVAELVERFMLGRGDISER